MNKIKHSEERYPSVLHKNFRELINYCADNYNVSDAFILKNKKGKDISYTRINFIELKQHVNWLGSGMLAKGLQSKRIAIIGNNCYQWVLGYFATLCGLGLCIPLDKGLPFEEVEVSLIRSYADVLIFDKAHAEIIEELKKSNKTQVTEYICMDKMEGYTSIPELMSYGKKELESGNETYLSLPINEKETTIILFTSGTTSMAKAVQLSQYNILANTYAMLKVEDIRHGDRTMAFLPYHHTFGSTGQVVMLAAGVTTTYCDGLKYVQKNIVEYKITLFICVPLLIETIYKKIMIQVKKQGKEKKVAFGIKLCNFLLKFGIDIRRKVFKEIIDQLGGELRFIISGASAINPEALKGFLSFGIETVQGYGLTETSPVLAAETSAERKLGSIGLALPGVELDVFEPNEEGIGELIAKGPNVMCGYYENQEETDKVIIDGWFHTGDLVSIDKDGYVFIRGRKKNVIVLKNGKNVYPEELEVLINNLPYVEECMVYGEPKFNDGNENDLALCAKIVYKPDYMKETFQTETPDEIEKIISKDIDILNESLPTYKHMLRITTTDQPMVKTTTGKVKRHEEIKK